MTDVDAFHTLRNGLLAGRTHLGWPDMTHFNWALDHFDSVAGDRPALWIVEEDGREDRLTFADLSARSNRVANYLRELGVGRGDHVLLMLGNVVPLWETMLAAMKLGAVMIPASTLLGPDDLVDRVDRGDVKAVVAADDLARGSTTCPGRRSESPWATTYQRAGSRSPTPAAADAAFTPDAGRRPMIRCCSTSPRARPRSPSWCCTPIAATRSATCPPCTGSGSSPATSTSTSPRQAGPSTPGAASSPRGTPRPRSSSTTTPASTPPPCSTRWPAAASPPSARRPRCGACSSRRTSRRWDLPLRELVGAGEPLNPEVIEQVQAAWGITIRDGYGQTETTAQIGNAPGMKVKPGSMGRPLPGYTVALLDAEGKPADEGEIASTCRAGRSA